MKFIIITVCTAALLISANVIDNNSTVVKSKEIVEPSSTIALDQYRVIKVNGQIVYTKSGKDMHQGDVFASNASLKFKTSESRAAVISKLKGRKILTAKSSKGNKATLLPAMNGLSTRSGGIVNLLDLKNHFNGSYLVIDEAKVKIGGKDFTQGKGNFFFLRYDYNGETINKKLSSSEDSLILNPDEIFKIDGKSIDGSKINAVKLYYRNGSKSQYINQFAPQFVKGDDLKMEVQIIIEELKDKEKKEKTDEVTSYLIENYAKPGRDNLNWYLENNFKM